MVCTAHSVQTVCFLHTVYTVLTFRIVYIFFTVCFIYTFLTVLLICIFHTVFIFFTVLILFTVCTLYTGCTVFTVHTFHTVTAKPLNNQKKWKGGRLWDEPAAKRETSASPDEGERGWSGYPVVRSETSGKEENFSKKTTSTIAFSKGGRLWDFFAGVVV